MKENTIKVIVATITAGLTAYFNIMAVPIIMLTGVMIIDYISGMVKAWYTGKLSSRIGAIGIVKKVSYLLVVIVAGVVDWLISSGLSGLGISFDSKFYFGLIVTIWFIINECISILENLAILNVPLPKFLTNAIHKLKVVVESKADKEDD